MTSQLHFARTQPAPTRSRRRGRHHRGVLVAVAAGGALGTLARYGLAQLVPVTPGRFPWLTLGVNVSGCLVLGVVLVLVLERFPPNRSLRPFIATGFLGAYTTYSTFAVETVLLVRDGHPATAAAYMTASLVAGLGAVWIGVMVARTVLVPSAAGGRS